jgi:hypothetical protein
MQELDGVGGAVEAGRRLRTQLLSEGLATTAVSDDGVDRGAVVAACHNEVLDHAFLAVTLTFEANASILRCLLEDETVQRGGAMGGLRRRTRGACA